MMRSVLQVKNEHGRALHETQKPLGIIVPLVRYSVPPGGVVLDPFAGSGTTCLAAKMEGRHSIGIELRKDCAEIAERRIMDDAPLLACV
jgi:site-specific DNA-methyltransferase (adenine-specific)